jgi:phosphatidylglycerophosphatase C
MKLALFDFDDTISSKDTYLDFILHAFKSSRNLPGLINHYLLLFFYLTGIIRKETWKVKAFKSFFCNWKHQDFRDFANDYCNKRLKNIIKDNALQRILWHKQEGHVVAIVSGSLEEWLLGWCNDIDVKLIANSAKVDNGRLTGHFSMPDCYGREKVNRIIHTFDLSEFDYIFAYGDSKADLEMLELADEKYYKYF